jgi:hypothetical protein
LRCPSWSMTTHREVCPRGLRTLTPTCYSLQDVFHDTIKIDDFQRFRAE